MLESLLGIRVTLLLGPTIAVPAPLPVLEALSSIEVTLKQAEMNGCQMTFTLGRGPLDAVDYRLMLLPLLRPFNRVVIQVWMGVLPEVLFDGFITHQQMQLGHGPGEARLTVTADDVRTMLDMHEITMVWPGMAENVRAEAILAKYILYFGTKAKVLAALPLRVPDPFTAIPMQSDTDLGYLEEMAFDVGHVFYVEPGLAPMLNTVYWGPENRLSKPQKPLSVNLGPATNTAEFSASYDAMQPRLVVGAVQDTKLGLVLPVPPVPPVQVPLAAVPGMAAQMGQVRTVQMRDGARQELPAAMARARELATKASNAATAKGELDALRYGALLRANRLVGVRGAGTSQDGFWFVEEVTHRISKGSYRQSFVLHREGFGPLSPLLPT